MILANDSADFSTLTAIIAAFRTQVPLVQCLTNTVVSQITANALLAAGASPAMCDTPSESYDFAQIATGVLINAGTPTAEQYQGMRRAIAGASDAGTPWVLDPVAAGALGQRTAFYHEAVVLNPQVIRGNASEVAVLSGAGSGGRGVDATDSVEALVPAAAQLADRTGGIVAVSGPTDLIVSTDRLTWVRGGHPTMARVIGTGCFLGALCAGYVGAAKTAGLDLHWAVVAAHAHTSAAGAIAGSQYADRPGSFAVAWLDALATLTADNIVESVSLSTTERDFDETPS